jgi:hypothetical protein
VQAGVLEPEELSTMIGSGKHMLPGIEEDIHKSTDSISTLASDNLTLENLETDLFGDIRASIQRSTKGSDVANSTSKVVSPETENASIPCKYMSLFVHFVSDQLKNCIFAAMSPVHYHQYH